MMRPLLALRPAGGRGAGASSGRLNTARARSTRCASLRRMGSLLGIALAVVAAAPGPYFSKPFEVHAHSHDFGQAPTWTRDGGVLSQEDDRSGIQQVWRSRLDGSRKRCLTCGRTSGSSGFAEERPQGDWVMFCSWTNSPIHLGGPGLGGYGS